MLNSVRNAGRIYRRMQVIAGTLVLLVVTGCGGDTNAPPPQDRTVKGVVELPTGVPITYSDLYATAARAQRSAVQSEGSFEVAVSIQNVQSVFVTDSRQRLVYITLAFPASGRQSGTELKADALSTATTLILLTPGVCPSANPVIVKEAWDKIQTRSETRKLAQTIASVIKTKGYLDFQHQALRTDLANAVIAVVRLFLSESRSGRGIEVTPVSHAGLTITAKSSSGGKIVIDVENNKKRMVDFYSSADGDKVVGSVRSARTRNPVNLFDLYELLQDTSVDEPGRNSFYVSLSQGETTLTGYGPLPLGLADVITKPSTAVSPAMAQAVTQRYNELSNLRRAGRLERLAGPTVKTLMSDVLLPLVQIVAGLDQKAALSCFEKAEKTILAEHLTLVTNIFNGILNRDTDAVTRATGDLLLAILLTVFECILETAGVELPQWVSAFGELVSRAHAVVESSRTSVDTASTPLYSDFRITVFGDIPVVVRSVENDSHSSDSFEGRGDEQ